MTVYLNLLEWDTNKTKLLCMYQLDLLYSIECKFVDNYIQTPLLVLGISPKVCTYQMAGQWNSPKWSVASYC